jgi:sterol desaturase/sphingolipid hydroxylase (fatty acid hydroxylase superfamily)
MFGQNSGPTMTAVKDPTVVAIPLYFGTMGAEYLWLRDREGPRDVSAGRYERRDTLASLSMGVGSLVAPLLVPKALKHVTPGKGRYGKALVGVAICSAAVTTIADRLARLEGTPKTEKVAATARKVASAGGVTAVVAGGTAFTTWFAGRTTLRRMWDRRVVKDLGTGPGAIAAATLGWDFIYYWNHRSMHECRALWAIHVVHHSSERYNLSTALRQPVAEAFGAFVPYSLLCLVGIRPELVNTARGLNLLYQYWIHTESIERLGVAEEALNTPSHHRVHHGSNRRYLDRNHGSILILWDRLFGTFERESEPVVYGLTKNIGTFNPLRIAAHEHYEMLKDVAAAGSWRDRVGFVLRGPGWAGRRRAELAGEHRSEVLSEAARSAVPVA